jgi:hypothetical protein
MVIAFRPASLLLLLPPLLLVACSAPPPSNQAAPAGKQGVASAPAIPVKPVHWNGIFSCTAHVEGRLPAITWRRIPFRQEGDRLTGLYTFTDSFKYQDSVIFSGTLAAQTAKVTVTAMRANGSQNFTVEMAGRPALMTGTMMSGTSQSPVRSCTLVLTGAAV